MATRMNKFAFTQAAHATLKTIELDLTAFGEEFGSITIRELTAGQALELGKKVRADDSEVMIDWIMATVVDDAGALMFTSDNDRVDLRNMGAKLLFTIGQAAMTLNNVAADTETAKN